MVTGHTGFKGGWLSLWLSRLGAEVAGYSLPPSIIGSFCEEVAVPKIIASSVFGDIRDFQKLSNTISQFSPEIVFHLAAQPIVLRSFSHPVETFEINAMGTVNLFEALRKEEGCSVIVNITTDKVYKNNERKVSFKEGDLIGGLDPYASSKSCSELISDCYRSSFFGNKISLSTARAGNVIAGGDWSDNRLIPDLFRSYYSKENLEIRSPRSIRPWQHVLEPLRGYLLLAQAQYQDTSNSFSTSWNFGPGPDEIFTVGEVVEFFSERGLCSYTVNEQSQKKESETLKLDSSKANIELGWYPKWNTEKALLETMNWYLEHFKKKPMYEYSLNQIEQYENW